LGEEAKGVAEREPQPPSSTVHSDPTRFPRSQVLQERAGDRAEETRSRGFVALERKKHTPGEASRLLPPEIKRESKSKSLPGQKAEGRAAGTQLHPGKAEAGSALPISLAVLSLSISLSLRI
jgi:hypothetical protein